jgi:hypothetical protein
MGPVELHRGAPEIREAIGRSEIQNDADGGQKKTRHHENQRRPGRGPRLRSGKPEEKNQREQRETGIL